MKRLPRAGSWLRTAVGVLAAAGLAPSVWAQAAQVTTDPGPHYAGEPVAVRVTAVGFEEEPPPRAEVPPPASGRIDLVGVSPSVSQSITIVNGQISRTREVTHVFQFRFVPERPGPVELGPFRISQGPLRTSVAAVQLRVQDVPSSDDLAVFVELPPGPVFLGERVPVTVSFRLETGLQKNLLEYQLRVPLFDDPSFRFLDDRKQGDANVQIATAGGVMELRGTSRQVEENGKRYTLFSVERTMVPLSPGRHAIGRASLSVEEGVRFRRDFFGGRRATQVRRWRAESPARELEVAQIPGQKQPASYGGAIGRGFTLEVSADRTVVQVGDPITLTFELRGEGLETASLPRLDGEGMLPPSEFRVPDGVPTGEIVGADLKQFTATVRVLSEDVEEIPGLAYSWFDPDRREYQTTTSRPIALSVRSAEVIGAGQVQVGEGVEVATVSSPAREDDGAQTPAARSFALTGADLAIERDPARLRGGSASWGGPWLTRAVYAGSLLLLLASVWDRRRRDVDPATVRRRRLLRDELKNVRATVERPGPDALAVVSQAVRRMLQAVPEASTPELDAFLGECDARSYAPGGAAAPDPELLARAARLAEGIAEAGEEG